MADGRVITGFSSPVVAVYAASGGSVTYTDAAPLARGVEVDMSVDASTDNVFYANNQEAENLSGVFAGGTVALTVDGLKDAARKLILGLPSADGDGWTSFGDDQAIPYVGLGFNVRYMEDGATTYMPVILPKVMFANPGLTAATQEAEVDWQTQELSATIYRDDTANHNWIKLGAAVSTESSATSAIMTFFS